MSEIVPKVLSRRLRFIKRTEYEFFVPRVKYIFRRGNHWSDKWSVILDFEARKDFMKKDKRCFLCLKPDNWIRNCTKTKPCYYCKGMRNSAICNDQNKQGNQTSMNCASNVLFILLQTVDIVLENPNNKS